MCGIVGIFNTDKNLNVEQSLIKQMCSVIKHRGPDDEGIFINSNIGMGMRRLSIIDLHTGRQPMFNEDESIALVFNGEIYNYQELRTELIAKGHRFLTQSDTESLVHGYEEFGINVVHRLNGMFGFAIWDNNIKTLFVCRDRIGIKPVYYYKDSNKIIFGSEIKSIIEDKTIPRNVSNDALEFFLAYGYAPAPFTMFENIKKLPPGHYLKATVDSFEITEYWNVPDHPDKDLGLAYYKDKFNSILRKSIQRRLIADVPLGAFLSGGMDSTAIVTLMSDITNSSVKTYSIGFGGIDSFHNELSDARFVADRLKTDHHEIVVEPDVIDLFPKLMAYMDEPVADSSIIVTYLVSKLASEKVKVILSGVGGDELFGGYRRYLGYSLNRYYAILPEFVKKMLSGLVESLPVDRNSFLLNHFRLAKAFIQSASLSSEQQYNSLISLFNRDDKRTMMKTTDNSADGL